MTHKIQNGRQNDLLPGGSYGGPQSIMNGCQSGCLLAQLQWGKKEKILVPYQINQKLLNATGKNSLVMHCLPAHRGMEITSEVLDGENSIVFDQAENRLHVQKAILETLLLQPSQ